MRTIGVVTVARSDYGYYLPVLRRIQMEPDLDLHLIVAGMHLSPEYGLTVRTIEQDGFTIGDRVEMLLSSDTPEAIAKSMGIGTIGFAQSFARFQPDILVVLGDRFDMHAAVVASLPFKIPVAHLGGGESTEGLIDEPIRHSITKMSHLHFATTDYYAKRIVRMGEEPWRVMVSGAPTLDNLEGFTALSHQELQERHGIKMDGATLLVTYHPVTLQYEHTEAHVESLLQALDDVDLGVVFTYPNADTQNRVIVDKVHRFTERHAKAQVAVNLGTQGYFSLMSHAHAMVGNSSSGVIEAASFKLPVVNIGDRQRGRIHAQNVIDVGSSSKEITTGIETALSDEFRAGLADLSNPYGDGHSAERIVERLRVVELDNALMMKRFYNDEVPLVCA